MTDVLRVDPNHPDPSSIGRAAECLRAGGLVAFPTETVYGLGVHALDAAAVRRLFDAKGRPATDPLIVHVLSLEDAERLVRALPDVARLLAARFWPGPLTMVMPRAAIVPDEVTAGLDTVALRVPAHPVARALLAQARLPVAAPSANLFSRPSPTRAGHVLEDLAGRIDLILDGGPTLVGIESTVVDLSHGTPVILRPGAVTAEMLGELVAGVRAAVAPGGESQTQGGRTSGTGRRGQPADAVDRGRLPDGAHQGLPSARAMPSPGLLAKHYSPRAPLTLYDGPRDTVLDRLSADARAALDRAERIGVIVADGDAERVAAGIGAGASRLHLRTLGGEDDLGAVAARLYDGLRELDSAGVEAILVRGFPAESGLGVAILDRLRRAAAGRIVHC